MEKRGNFHIKPVSDYVKKLRKLEVIAALMLFSMSFDQQQQLEELLFDCGISTLED